MNRICSRPHTLTVHPRCCAGCQRVFEVKSTRGLSSRRRSKSPSGYLGQAFNTLVVSQADGVIAAFSSTARETFHQEPMRSLRDSRTTAEQRDDLNTHHGARRVLCRALCRLRPSVLLLRSPAISLGFTTFG